MAEFKWIPNQSGSSKEYVSILFQFEKYQTIFIGNQNENFITNYKRMVPYQEKGKYFYKVDD
jgi:hypothetical protein